MSSELDDIFTEPHELEARASAELARSRDRDAWRAMVDSAHGRRILRWLVRETGVLGASVSPDAISAGRAEGRRMVGVSVIREVNEHAPESFTTLFEDDDE